MGWGLGFVVSANTVGFLTETLPILLRPLLGMLVMKCLEASEHLGGGGGGAAITVQEHRFLVEAARATVVSQAT